MYGKKLEAYCALQCFENVNKCEKRDLHYIVRSAGLPGFRTQWTRNMMSRQKKTVRLVMITPQQH